MDSEPDRYLEFDRWWGGHVNLNAEEIQFIVDELFVGNDFAAGCIKTSDGQTVDLRNISSPIVVFCSKGDNITGPQQALGWILDLYSDVDDIRTYGKTIVYTVHETVGHLGIFVSGGVEEGAQRILEQYRPDRCAATGLYEATFEAKSADTANPDLAEESGSCGANGARWTILGPWAATRPRMSDGSRQPPVYPKSISRTTGSSCSRLSGRQLRHKWRN